MDDIHSRIKALRLGLGLSMEAVANAVGVSWQTVQQWEKAGGTAPKRDRLQRVADVLKTSKTYLLDGAHAPGATIIAEPQITPYIAKTRHARKLVERVCDIAETIDDAGLRTLIDMAECLARNHPLVKAKPV